MLRERVRGEDGTNASNGRVDLAADLAVKIDHGQSYIRFITTLGIEPANHLAEQAIRFVAINRNVTQGSRTKA